MLTRTRGWRAARTAWRMAIALATAPVALALTPAQLGVVINTADPLSAAVGQYYVQQRHIPERNVSRVAFDFHRTTLTAAEFRALKARVDAQLPAAVQAYALTWAQPYRVDCMSITAAFALGFDTANCASGCAPTLMSAYYDSTSAAPFADLHLRPAMSVAARTLDEARRLIDRGVSSDGTAPAGTAYLVSSGDPDRDVRRAGYADAALIASGRMRTQLLSAAALRGRGDVMFYFIGAAQVPDLETNHFLPGAVADHLTSTGGMLTDSAQMSSLRWLEAGATGSYGAVVEPCNFTAKFPNPALLMLHYLAGETLIESYWKSVAMPGQGVFIGEPLASPYRRTPLVATGR
jgi:uncharacterized protein (TIGR03790 family)